MAVLPALLPPGLRASRGTLYNVNRMMLCCLQTHVLIFVYFQKKLKWPFMEKKVQCNVEHEYRLCKCEKSHKKSIKSTAKPPD